MTAEALIAILKEDGHINSIQEGILLRAIRYKPEDREVYMIKATEGQVQAIKKQLRGTECGLIFIDDFEIKPLTPEKKRGKWNEILEPFGWDDIKSAQCSACGESYPYPTDCGFDDIVEMFKFCPECGAQMEAGTRWKEEEEE